MVLIPQCADSTPVLATAPRKHTNKPAHSIFTETGHKEAHRSLGPYFTRTPHLQNHSRCPPGQDPRPPPRDSGVVSRRLRAMRPPGGPDQNKTWTLGRGIVDRAFLRYAAAIGGWMIGQNWAEIKTTNI